jgi:hypothetical protein
MVAASANVRPQTGGQNRRRSGRIRGDEREGQEPGGGALEPRGQTGASRGSRVGWSGGTALGLRVARPVPGSGQGSARARGAPGGERLAIGRPPAAGRRVSSRSSRIDLRSCLSSWLRTNRSTNRCVIRSLDHGCPNGTEATPFLGRRRQIGPHEVSQWPCSIPVRRRGSGGAARWFRQRAQRRVGRSRPRDTRGIGAGRMRVVLSERRRSSARDGRLRRGGRGGPVRAQPALQTTTSTRTATAYPASTRIATATEPTAAMRTATTATLRSAVARSITPATASTKTATASTRSRPSRSRSRTPTQPPANAPRNWTSSSPGVCPQARA